MCLGIVGSAKYKLLSRVSGIASDNLDIYDTTVMLWLGGSALADIIIAISMIIALRKMRIGHSTIDVIVNRLVLMTIETGSLTAGVAIIALGLFAVPNVGTLSIGPLSIISKLYANSVLISLNNRVFVQRGTPGTDDSSSLVQRLNVRDTSPVHIDFPQAASNDKGAPLSKQEASGHKDILA